MNRKRKRIVPRSATVEVKMATTWTQWQLQKDVVVSEWWEKGGDFVWMQNGHYHRAPAAQIQEHDDEARGELQ